MGQNWPFRVILSHSDGKRLEKLQIWQNWPFQVILSHSGGKDWKIANRVKLAILSHSEPLRWDKIEKVVNQAKLAILTHSGSLHLERLEKLQIR